MLNISFEKIESWGYDTMKPASYRWGEKVKGLEPLIASIILVAITLVIAIAVSAWLMGLFETTVGGAEKLVILPNASLRNISGTWVLNVSIRNTGSSPSTIIALYAANYTCDITSATTTVNPGETITLDSECADANFIVGVRYTIRVVTAAGNAFYSEVIARP